MIIPLVFTYVNSSYLSGGFVKKNINKMCLKCKKKCKQLASTKIVSCKSFETVDK